MRNFLETRETEDSRVRYLAFQGREVTIIILRAFSTDPPPG